MKFNLWLWLKIIIRIKVWDPIWNTTVNWLNTEKTSTDLPPVDFKQLCYELRPGDVVLVEGRSRVSEVIKLITQSPWTHSALYIGHIYDIANPQLKQKVQSCFKDSAYKGRADAPLIIEALLGEGTVVHSIEKYRHDHLRICRPSNITPKDAQKVTEYGINKLGSEYHVRQLLDLARFLFPYSLLPRRWRSSLFLHDFSAINNSDNSSENNTSENKASASHTVCSSMISEAFGQIQFPILPVTEQLKNGEYNLYMRNPRLMIPKDFDYSPYFEIIKYPIYRFDRVAMYKKMPWNAEGLVCHGPGDCYLPEDAASAQSYPRTVQQHKINLIQKNSTKTYKKTDSDFSLKLWSGNFLSTCMNSLKHKNLVFLENKNGNHNQ